MELGTQALDRLIQALTPVLSTELERAIHEVHQQLQAEFRQELDSAVQMAELNVLQQAEVRAEQTVAEAREQVRLQVTGTLQSQFDDTLRQTKAELIQVTETLQHQFEEKLQQTIESLQKRFDAEMEKAVASWTSERQKLQAQVDKFRLLADAQRQLSECSSQVELLARFLKLSQTFAGTLAIYVARADGLAMWKSRGDAAFPELVSPDTIDPEFYFHPVSVRDRTVAAVCALKPASPEALDFLVTALERSIETFGTRLHPAAVRPIMPAPSPSSASDAALPANLAADERLHADARRTARLLVSEIALYNEQEVADGRANHDIYRRLQKVIEQGREQYRQRVHGAVLASADYFHDELVRVLAETDAARLGAGYPGPMRF